MLNTAAVRAAEWLALLAAAALCAVLLLGRLGQPLFWADEAETAMFGERVLDHGYPKVHGERNVVYQFGPNIAVGVDEATDAYIGTTWGPFYFAAPGLLWARAVADPHERTRRARLPFALAGAAAVGVWLWALVPAFPDAAGRRRFAAAFLLLSASSVSLLLHLRELRYYALVVLLGGLLVRLHLAYAVYARAGFRRWAIGTAVLLWLLFHFFFQAFFAFGALLGAERVWALARGRGGWRELAPFAAAGLAVAPFALFFETFATAAVFAEGFGLGPAAVLENLRVVSLHLLRFEYAGPALALRAAVVLGGVGSRAQRRAAAGLLALAAGTVLLGCLNPLPLERYFLVVSPMLTGAFLLDAFALVGAAAERGGRRAGLALALALVLATGLARQPVWEPLAGRWAELREPVRGPLDHAIPYLLERYERPQELVIATNYEEMAFMYYLGSHVIVGLSLNNLARERGLVPDVVVPRRHWPRSLRALQPFLAATDGWETVRFPVRDLHYNNVPALSTSRFLPQAHLFRTAESRDPDTQLRLLYRPDSTAKRTGTSSRP